MITGLQKLMCDLQVRPCCNFVTWPQIELIITASDVCIPGFQFYAGSGTESSNFEGGLVDSPTKLGQLSNDFFQAYTWKISFSENTQESKLTILNQVPNKDDFVL